MSQPNTWSPKVSLPRRGIFSVSTVVANSNCMALSYFLGQCKMFTRCHVCISPGRWYKKATENFIVGTDIVNLNRISNEKRIERGSVIKTYNPKRKFLGGGNRYAMELNYASTVRSCYLYATIAEYVGNYNL